MKRLRTLSFCIVLSIAVSELSGCATIGGDSSSDPKPSPTDDMNWVEKTGYYLWWPFQQIIYGIAAGNPSFSP
jgi:hypothetical protein